MKKVYIILAIIVFPLWIFGAGREIADSFLIRDEGKVTTGRIVEGQWRSGKSRYYDAKIVYAVDGREWQKEFRISSDVMKKAGAATLEPQMTLDVRYAASRPQAAELVLMPGDSPWISAIVAGFGMILMGTILVFDLALMATSSLTMPPTS